MNSPLRPFFLSYIWREISIEKNYISARNSLVLCANRVKILFAFREILIQLPIFHSYKITKFKYMMVYDDVKIVNLLVVLVSCSIDTLNTVLFITSGLTSLKKNLIREGTFCFMLNLG